MAKFQLDIDGFEETVYAYVIPGQSDPLILGKGWLRLHDASVRPARDQILLRKPIQISLSTKPVLVDSTILPISAAAISCPRSRSQPKGSIRVFSATLKDIQKALEQKAYLDLK